MRPLQAHGDCLISIHALREEGDLAFRPTGIFEEAISIHALREEGDNTVPNVKKPQR